MPENYYCLDNFFHKVTDMESPRKNNDCYFYYYSTCTKGDNCTFRHEPSALGCETTCQFWKEGKCINVRCNFRHMELRKNRKVIPCYWETQPGGCLKPHCPFLHQNPKHPSNLDNQGEGSDIKRTQDLNKPAAIQSTDSCAKNLNHGPEKNFGNAVENPLVVNFEEESDNESAPTHSPVKTPHGVKVKTLEEIRLEKVQAESAAFYSYPEFSQEDNDDLRERIIKRITKKSEEQKPSIEVLTLTEIRKRKRLHFDPTSESLDETLGKKQKVTLKIKKESDISEVKIKTLEEIRAERAKRLEAETTKISLAETTTNKESGDDCEVTSTSKGEVEEETKDYKRTVKIQPIKRLKRTRIVDEGANKETEESTKANKIPKLHENLVINEKLQETHLEEEDKIGNVTNEKDIAKEDEFDLLIAPSGNQKALDATSFDSAKLDDVLLLDEDEFDVEGATKPEEDILKDIDDLLNE